MHWHTYRPKRPRKDRPSNTVRLEQLSDQELMTIRVEFSRLDAENLRIDAANRSAKYEHERLYGKYNRMRDLAYEYDMGVVSPLIQEKHRIMAELKPHKVGVISGILGDALIAHDERVKYRFKRNDATARLVAKLNEVFRKIAEGEAHHKHMLAPIPNHPLDHNVLKRKNNFSVKVVGSEYSVRYSETNNAARIDELLKKRQSQRDKKVEAQERQKNIEINNKNRQELLRARADANEKEIRDTAKNFKAILPKQLLMFGGCPYCGGALSGNNAHLDHIYPVSKGGRSTSVNLVFVCSPCNNRKRNYTLREFIERSGFVKDQVHQRLKLLDKDF